MCVRYSSQPSLHCAEVFLSLTAICVRVTIGHDWSLEHCELKEETGLDSGSLTHQFFQEVSVTVVRKVNSKLLFVVPVPQVATKLHPQVHKQWLTPVNHAC